jgi:outer membrane protein OmpA-like peptidoglycan-associated protein
MIPKSWIVKGAAAASLAAFCAGALAGCSSIPPVGGRTWDGCAAIGAVAGAGIGAASGIVIYDNSRRHPVSNDGKAYSGIGGAAVGGLLGGLAGHFICDPLVPPPPPPPPMAEAPPPPPPPPPPVEHHEKLVLRGVHFDFNKSKIRPGDAAILDEAADILKSHPDVTIYDDGYCDAIGSEEYNLKLSQRRAESVAKYLEDKGIPEAKIIPRGFGKTDFVAPNDTDEGRAQNRRVELKPTE